VGCEWGSSPDTGSSEKPHRQPLPPPPPGQQDLTETRHQSLDSHAQPAAHATPRIYEPRPLAPAHVVRSARHDERGSGRVPLRVQLCRQSGSLRPAIPTVSGHKPCAHVRKHARAQSALQPSQVHTNHSCCASAPCWHVRSDPAALNGKQTNLKWEIGWGHTSESARKWSQMLPLGPPTPRPQHLRSQHSLAGSKRAGRLRALSQRDRAAHDPPQLALPYHLRAAQPPSHLTRERKRCG
jgi:hypothetical protein